MKRSITALLILMSFVMIAPVASLTASAHEPQQVYEDYNWVSIPAQFMMGESQSQAQPVNNNIQVFDVAKGKVVHAVANNEQFQKTAEQWLGQITSLAPEIQPDMKATYIVRVPVDPAKPLKVGQVTLTVKEIFLFYYADPNKEPLLLMFDDNKKPYFFHIHEDITPFIKSLNIPS
ncbi:hypothetical protein [Paenibacillus camelliae]|uniref:hypothetical protein n=1 Tax=Paenibacillus camelliae TaxID=512410 RepID=UPI00203A7DD8|nr:hypothetical protein [Paenibacillus camelliae]MCM3633001.1 hypothetical protein [Paenibacillus camelliae]